MFFVHPQIKFNNLDKVILSLVKPIDLENLIQRLSIYFPEKQFIFTDMGRSAFRVIIEKLNLQNSEILLPAYICDIFYPTFKQYNIKPFFLDIDLRTFHLKVDEIKQKITPKTKAILVCHTYGLPFDIKKLKSIILNISNNSNILIIEDCAHSFGIDTGNLGDVAFFSLYKQFPSLRGGMLVCPPEWKAELPKTSFDFRDFISLLNCFSIFASLFKRFGGKIAPKMIRGEKFLEPTGINRISLNLFSYFLEDFEKSIENRKKLALFFQEELKKLGFEVQESKDPAQHRTGSGAGNVFCYLSALVPESLREKRDIIVQKLKKYGVFCTRIWHTPIVLNKEVQKEYQINLTEFPNTIEAAKRIVNFPLQNYYSKEDITKIIIAIKETMKNL